MTQSQSHHVFVFVCRTIFQWHQFSFVIHADVRGVRVSVGANECVRVRAWGDFLRIFNFLIILPQSGKKLYTLRRHRRAAKRKGEKSKIRATEKWVNRLKSSRRFQDMLAAYERKKKWEEERTMSGLERVSNSRAVTAAAEAKHCRVLLRIEVFFFSFLLVLWFLVAHLPPNPTHTTPISDTDLVILPQYKFSQRHMTCAQLSAGKGEVQLFLCWSLMMTRCCL